jgi:hypothetical protein
MARQLDLKAIAITDHDTIAGSKDVLTGPMPPEIQFITGIEISAAYPPFYPGSGSFHMLGYGIHLEHPVLKQTLERLQAARENRNPEIVNRLNKLGFDMTFEEVLENAGKPLIGRPHIALLMLKKGFVSSINQAFDEYIGTGRPAYVDKFRVNCEDAIKIIRKSGGVPVIAHPGLIRPLKDTPFEVLISGMKEMGLGGIEVFYPQHSPEKTAYYARLAEQFGLMVTGGTDFHGSVKPDIQLGKGKGDFHVPYSAVEPLVRACAGSTSDFI